MVCRAEAADPKKPEGKGAAAAEATPPPPYDRICQIDVHYIYRPKLPPGETGSPSDSDELTKVFFTTISEQGMITEDIQKRLNTKLVSVRAEAMTACRSEHQEQDGCVVRKLAALSGEYPNLDYTRRKMLFDSIRIDCGNSLGSCLATESSEMKCWMNVPPEISVPNEPKVEVAQPGKAEPDYRVEEGDDEEDDGAEVSGDDEADDETTAVEAAAPGADPAVVKPKKKKKKKKKEDSPGPSGTPPAPSNPYSQPFSIP